MAGLQDITSVEYREPESKTERELMAILNKYITPYIVSLHSNLGAAVRQLANACTELGEMRSEIAKLHHEKKQVAALVSMYDVLNERTENHMNWAKDSISSHAAKITESNEFQNIIRDTIHEDRVKLNSITDVFNAQMESQKAYMEAAIARMLSEHEGKLEHINDRINGQFEKIADIHVMAERTQSQIATYDWTVSTLKGSVEHTTRELLKEIERTSGFDKRFVEKEAFAELQEAIHRQEDAFEDAMSQYRQHCDMADTLTQRIADINSTLQQLSHSQSETQGCAEEQRAQIEELRMKIDEAASRISDPDYAPLYQRIDEVCVHINNLNTEIASETHNAVERIAQQTAVQLRELKEMSETNVTSMLEQQQENAQRIADINSTLQQLSHSQSETQGCAEEQRAQIEELRMKIDEAASRISDPDYAPLYQRIDEVSNRLSEQSNTLSCMSESESQLRDIVTGNERWLRSASAKIDSIDESYKLLRNELFAELTLMGETGEAPKEKSYFKDSYYEKTKNGRIALNLGSATLNIDGYVNVDRRNLNNVDIVSDVVSLPFGSDEVDEIHAAHIIEHFCDYNIRNNLLPHWHHILKPQGKLTIVVPNMRFMMDRVMDGNLSFDDFNEVLFGGQEYSGDFHYSAFDPQKITHILTRAGFVNVCVVTTSRRNGLCWEMEIQCLKG